MNEVAETREYGTAITRPRRIPGILVAFAWGVNLGVLLALGGWLLGDGQAHLSLDVYLGVGSTVTPAAVLMTRMAACKVISILAQASAAIVLLGLFFGSPKCRGVRSWLAVTALTAAWLWIVLSRRDVAWVGQRWRLGQQIDRYETVAAALRDNWPDHDGSIAQLGPFSAYPDGNPHVLMPLTTPESRPGVAPFSVVERSDAGGLRFELVGHDAGSWVEWHPEGEKPASFVGGLDTDYVLTKSSALGHGWYLAKYRVAGLRGEDVRAGEEENRAGATGR